MVLAGSGREVPCRGLKVELVGDQRVVLGRWAVRGTAKVREDLCRARKKIERSGEITAITWAALEGRSMVSWMEREADRQYSVGQVPRPRR